MDELDAAEALHGINIETSDITGNTHLFAYTDDGVQLAVELFGMNPDLDDVSTAAAAIASLRGLMNKRPRVGVVWPVMSGSDAPAAASPPATPAAPADSLTAKEREALGWLVAGLSNKLVADRMGCSFSTAKFHVGNVIKKLRAENRAHAVAIAASMGYGKRPA